MKGRISWFLALFLSIGGCGSGDESHLPDSWDTREVVGEDTDVPGEAEYGDENRDFIDGDEGGCVPAADPSERVCDGIDNDCDGLFDEDYGPYRCGTGACETNSMCVAGVETCEPLEPESTTDTLCDGIDNDCDGEVDEEFQAVTCVGECARGSTCEDGVELCGVREEETDVTCDGLDGDCDGSVDEDYVPHECGLGECVNESTCSGGAESCTPLDPSFTDDRMCDGRDEDCDGSIDEDCVVVDFIYDRFDSGIDGWSFWGSSGYTLSRDTGTGQPAPSALISGDGYTINGGMQKAVDISSWAGTGAMTLSFDWRAASDYTGSTVTNANLRIEDAGTGTSLYEESLVAGGTTDTGWRSTSRDISAVAGGHAVIRIILWLGDGWSTNWNERNWYDNIRLTGLSH